LTRQAGLALLSKFESSNLLKTVSYLRPIFFNAAPPQFSQTPPMSRTIPH
jgi:hypothetical protein